MDLVDFSIDVNTSPRPFTARVNRKLCWSSVGVRQCGTNPCAEIVAMPPGGLEDENDVWLNLATISQCVVQQLLRLKSIHSHGETPKQFGSVAHNMMKCHCEGSRLFVYGWYYLHHSKNKNIYTKHTQLKPGQITLSGRTQ